MNISDIILATKNNSLKWVLKRSQKVSAYSTMGKEYVFEYNEEEGIFTLNGEKCEAEDGKRLLKCIKKKNKKPIIIISKKNREENKPKKKKTKYVPIQELELARARQESRKKNKGYALEKSQEKKTVEEVETNKIEVKRENDYIAIGYKDFVVRKSTFNCWNKNHHTTDLTATVSVLSKDPRNTEKREVKLSAGFCKECNIYFIMESGYEKLKNLGIPMCRISDEKHYKSSVFCNGMQLSQESILMQYGYNVNQEEGLTETVRHKILASLIDNKVMTKSDIVSYIDFFISQRQAQPRFEMAISKWEKDREFVNEYKMGDYTQMGIKAIRRL